MKAYYNAGLKELAMTSGYRSETLQSLEKCSNFKRTHSFLIQAWQALYQRMLHAYVDKHSLTSLAESLVDILTNSDTVPEETLMQVNRLLSENDLYHDFQVYITTCGKEDNTWKYWSQFVFKDCMAYIGLYLAIRLETTSSQSKEYGCIVYCIWQGSLSVTYTTSSSWFTDIPH